MTRRFGGALLAGALVVGLAAPASAIDAGSTVAVSRPTGFGGVLGAEAANSFATTQSTSSDGTKVVFASFANGMSPDDNDSVVNVYLRDRAAHTTTLISRSTAGDPGNGNSSDAVITPDGTRVAFDSEATNLVADDNDGTTDVFVRVLATGTTTLVSRSSGPANTAAGGAFPSISSNGNRIAFASAAAMDTGDTNGVQDIYLRDLSNETTELISRATGISGAPSTTFSFSPAISGNGERVGFSSQAQLDPVADTTGFMDVYMRDTSSHTTTLISRANGATGAIGNEFSGDPSLNNTGSRIAFDSGATNLTDDTDQDPDVFVRDLSSSTTLLASRANGATGASANGESDFPSIDLGGTKVAFRSAATNIGPFPSPGAAIRVRDMTANTTTTVSRASGASGVVGSGNAAAISPTGTFISFEAVEADFSNDDANDFEQVYTRELTGADPQTDLDSRPTGTGALAGSGGDSHLSLTGREVSADGRYVVFSSNADALSPDDDDGATNVYRRDLVTGETLLVSRADGPAGAPGSGDSLDASISSDGNVIAFESNSPNLVPGDSNGRRDVFVRDVSAATTQLASRFDVPNGIPGDGDSLHPAISGNGRFVAFASVASLTADDGDADEDVFRRDLQTGAMVLVSRTDGAGGAKANHGSDRPALDASGRHVAFNTLASNLDPADTAINSDIYLRDVDGATTTLVSRGDGFGPPAANVFDSPAISDDGARVAFDTSRANLVADDSGSNEDAFVRDVPAARTLLVSRSSSGELGDANSSNPSLSADGNRVAFTSSATNLATGVAPFTLHVFVRDISAGTTEFAARSDSAAGGQPASASSPSINGAGNCVAFASNARDLLPGGSGTGEFTNVYVHALSGQCPVAPPVSEPPAGGGGGAPPPPAGNPPDTTRPTLDQVKIAPTRFAVTAKATPTAARAHRGARLSWRLSEAARITIRIEQARAGRRKGRRCVKPTRKLRRAKHCTLWAFAGTLTRRSPLGRSGTAFSGRIGRRALKVGSYRALVRAVDAAGNKSALRTVGFKIVRR
jgi:Tol biopolymer transport system component